MLVRIVNLQRTLLGFVLVFCTLLLQAQNPLEVLPGNYSLAFENGSVRVIRVHYRPREKLPVHDHSTTPTVYVYLSDSGPVRFTHVEDHPFSLVRRPVNAGTFRVSPGRLEKHQVENLSDAPSDFLRVELKTLPLGEDSIAFRGNKPFDLRRTGIITAFDSGQLTIDRIIAAPASPAQNFRRPASGLLIAFTPAVISWSQGADSPGNHHIQPGDVLWTPPSFDVQPNGAPTHLLRITLK